jgi:hypothetical protein
MGLSTTYTKAETDYLLQQIDKKVVEGYKGDLRISDSAPTEIGYYLLLDVGTYTNLGGINAQSGKLNFASFDGTTWSKVEVVMPDLQLSTSLNPDSTDKAETGKSISDAYPKEYQSDNLFDKTVFVDNKFFSYADVNYTYIQIAADANGWFISDEILVTVGEDYYSKNAAFGFFDANDKMIAAFPVSNTEPKTAPSGAVYARLTSPKTYLDSIYFAKEKKQGFNHSSLKLESGQKTISKKLLPPSVLSRKGNNLIVSVRGGGDFRWINDALDWLRNSGENDVFNPFTFEIIDGEYVESVNMIGLFLTLKGRNKENCIIKTYTNDYYNPPIDMAGQNHLQNLTIIADDDGTTTPVNGVNNMPAYGIHFDISSRYENLDWKVQGRSVVKNCRVIAKHQHAVGQGLWTDTFSIWDDCEFYSPNNTAFRSHSYLPSGATSQRFLMRNCIVRTDINDASLVIQDANLAGGNDSVDTVYSFQNNIITNGNPLGVKAPNLLYTHDLTQGGTLSGKILLGNDSFGNNIEKLNY